MKTSHTMDYKLLDKIKDLSFEPVFILGLHRSGTSILYKMLGAAGKLNVLTAYHILNYDNLIYNHIYNLEDKCKKKLNDTFKIKGITTRLTDHMQVNSNYAHEYMYIFSERNYPWKITEKNKLLFDEICRKLKLISNNDYPLLFKNPHDYSNFLTIKKLYPNSKFIFIHRNPIDVISSTMWLWKTLLNSKNEYTAMFSKRYAQIFDIPLLLWLNRIFYTSIFPPGVFEVIHTCSYSTKYFLKNVNKIEENNFISIKYEDLCKNPNDTMSNILRFLDIKPGIDFSELIKPRNLKTESKVRFLNKYICRKMKPYFEYFNYKI